MISDRKKPGVAFWATVVVAVVLVGYPLSFGPACWWFAKEQISWGGAPCYSPKFYSLIGWIAHNAPRPVQKAICWYATLYSPSRVVIIPDSIAGVRMNRETLYVE